MCDHPALESECGGSTLTYVVHAVRYYLLKQVDEAEHLHHFARVAGGRDILVLARPRLEHLPPPLLDDLNAVLDRVRREQPVHRHLVLLAEPMYCVVAVTVVCVAQWRKWGGV